MTRCCKCVAVSAERVTDGFLSNEESSEYFEPIAQLPLFIDESTCGMFHIKKSQRKRNSPAGREEGIILEKSLLAFPLVHRADRSRRSPRNPLNISAPDPPSSKSCHTHHWSFFFYVGIFWQSNFTCNLLSCAFPGTWSRRSTS